MKIEAKPGDVLVFLLYDLMSFSGWRSKDEKYSDLDMQCRHVGIFKELHKESVVVHKLELIEDDDKSRKKVQSVNTVSVLPLGCIKKYKNMGRVLDWPKLET